MAFVGALAAFYWVRFRRRARMLSVNGPSQPPALGELEAGHAKPCAAYSATGPDCEAEAAAAMPIGSCRKTKSTPHVHVISFNGYL